MSALMQMYLEGASTRKLRDVTDALCGTSLSRSAVSSLVITLDADLAASRERPLGEVAYPFVLVDASYQHVRGVRLVVSDDHAGLRSAIQGNFPGVAWQRCEVPFQRNLAARVAKKHRASLMADARAMFQARTADMAARSRSRWPSAGGSPIPRWRSSSRTASTPATTSTSCRHTTARA